MTRRLSIVLLVFLLTAAATAAPGAGLRSLTPQDLREWLTYLASDELEGRGNFSEGLGLAGDYIHQHLRSWGLAPRGDRGSFLQTVRVLGVKTTNHSTVTVSVGGHS